MVLDIATATAEIQSMVRYQDFPTLDTAYEIPLLVRKSKRQDINRNIPDNYYAWTASTVYVLNNTVTPSYRGTNLGTSALSPNPGGFNWWNCTTAGTSGTVEPTWPSNPVAGQTVTDGTAVWTLGGAALWTPTWNLAYGISQGWKMKMGKAVGAYDIEIAGQKMSRSQLFKNMQEVHRLWARRAGFQDQIQLQGSLRDRRLFQAMTNQNDELFIDGQIQWNLLDQYYATRGFTGVSAGGQWIDP